MLGGLIRGLAAVLRNDMLVMFAALGVAALVVPHRARAVAGPLAGARRGLCRPRRVLFVNLVVERRVLGTPTGSARAARSRREISNTFGDRASATQ